MSKILLIGWDAADWKVIHPLMDAGKMPHLENLVNNGVMGNLATLYPHLSPMLWTSIATGKRAFKHGIAGFTEPDPHSGGIRPISNLSRKTKALWNILCQTGSKCNIIGWWPSHPAEPIHGVMVSNHYQKIAGNLDKPWPMRPGVVFPKRLADNLAKLRWHPEQLDEGHILPFVPRAAEIDQEKDRRLESLAKIICENSSIHAAATAIMHHEPWDFTAVYYDGIDHFCHGFMNYHPPKRKSVSQEDFEIYSPVVAKAYQYHDIMLGNLLDLAGEETTVILISDHGFHSDHLRPESLPIEPAGPAAQHRHYGIFVMKGPGIKKDETVYGASLLDICPTILTLANLPVGQDMDGKVLVNAFEKEPRVRFLPSWDEVPGEAGTHPPDLKTDPIEAQEVLKQLIDLGYIEKPNENREKAVAETVRELQYNLARSYMGGGGYLEAIEILEQLYQEWPEEHRFGVQLIQCYQETGSGDARKVLENVFAKKREVQEKSQKELEKKLSELKEKEQSEWTEQEKRELRDLRAKSALNPYAIEYLRGALLFEEGDAKGALLHLKNAEKSERNSPDIHIKLGNVYLQMERNQDAYKSFQKAIKLDPDNAHAHCGLARYYLAVKGNVNAAGETLKSVGLFYHNPLGHFTLGIALHRLNQIDKAIEALQVAVAQNPNFYRAYRRLAYIYQNRLKDTKKAEEYRELAKKAVKTIRALKKGSIPVKKVEEPLEPVWKSESQKISGNSEFDLEQTIVIVSGLPRSGTSMMMQMLTAGGMTALSDGKRKADEDNPKGYYEFEKAANLARDTSWLPQAKGKVVKIVAPLLPYLTPQWNYRIIFMERDIGEISRSQRKMLDRQGKKGATLSEKKLHDAYIRQVNQTKDLLAQRNIAALYLHFAECIESPQKAAAALNRFLGGKLDEQAMMSAIVPELRRVRQ